MAGQKREARLRADVPAIHVLHHSPMSGGYVYIMASAPNGILYVGVTSDLVQRIYQHRNGLVAGFTKRYGIKRLVSSTTTQFRRRSNASTT